jgi:hypothetical protein
MTQQSHAVVGIDLSPKHMEPGPIVLTICSIIWLFSSIWCLKDLACEHEEEPLQPTFQKLGNSLVDCEGPVARTIVDSGAVSGSGQSNKI